MGRPGRVKVTVILVPLPVCDHSQGAYFPPNRRRSIVFRVLFQQTNKQTNRPQMGKKSTSAPIMQPIPGDPVPLGAINTAATRGRDEAIRGEGEDRFVYFECVLTQNCTFSG